MLHHIYLIDSSCLLACFRGIILISATVDTIITRCVLSPVGQRHVNSTRSVTRASTGGVHRLDIKVCLFIFFLFVVINVVD